MDKKYEIDLEKLKAFLDKSPFKNPKSEAIEEFPSVDIVFETRKELSLPGILDGCCATDLSGWETSMTDPQSHSEKFRYLVHAVHEDHGLSRSMQMIALCQTAIAGEKIDFNPISLLQNP